MSKYSDDDFVYVDPQKREVIGNVKWDKSGNAIKMQFVEEGDKTSKKSNKKSYYPWGTYRTMKKIYKLEGKMKDENASQSLDNALNKATKEPFWD
jgi:hypothetical protein